MSGIPSRKREHVELSLGAEALYQDRTNGFEAWDFEHVALPELDFDEIDTTTEFLGKRLAFPLLVTGMTGGYAGAGRINAALAEACEEAQVALGVGSQRQMLLSDEHVATFRVVREHAPHIPVLANIGGAEVARMRNVDDALRLVECIGADALAVHLNPLQEFLQPEGNPQFRGVLAGISMLVRALPVPVVVKEVGAGITAAVARRLHEAGVRIIDVAGAGGTSWARIEAQRRAAQLPAVSAAFLDWGVPTAEALREIHAAALEGTQLIASGGIADGVMIAKAIAMGATLAGAARPVLAALDAGGPEGLAFLLTSWKNDVQGVMFLTGAATVAELATRPLRRSIHTSGHPS